MDLIEFADPTVDQVGLQLLQQQIGFLYCHLQRRTMGKPSRHRNASKKNPPHVAAPPPPIKGVLSSNSSIASAPNSVTGMCVPASPLARELSDLSGSYMNGNTAPRGGMNRSFGNSVCSEEPVQGFWRQAHILSTPCPKEHPQAPPSPKKDKEASALIVVERNGVIELVKKAKEEG